MDQRDLELQLRGMLQVLEEVTTDIGVLQGRQQDLQRDVEGLIDNDKTNIRRQILSSVVQSELSRTTLPSMSVPAAPPPPKAEETGGLFSDGSLANIARDRTIISSEDEIKYQTHIKSYSYNSHGR